MKSVKEIAETANVSKTSVYNLIKKHSIPTFKREGKTFLDESGESLVIGYYSTEQHETISDIITDTKETEEPNQSDFQDEFQDSKPLEYIKVISILESERTEKNNIIKELLQSNKILSQALAAGKVNEAARLMIQDTKYNTINNEPSTPSKENIFKRIFKRTQKASL